MTPTNLPLQPSTPAAAASGPAQTAGEPTQTADFLFMLGQLVAASVQRSGTTAAMPTSKIPSMVLDGAAKKDETSPEEMLAMFSMAMPPQPQMIPLQPATTAAVVEQALQALPGMLGGGADGAQQSVLQEVAQQGIDAKLFAEVAVEDVAHDARLPDSLQTSTAPFQLQQPQATHTTHAQGAIDRPLHTPVGSRAWADEVGTRVVMMTESGNHTASLKLSPEHLGPLEINITVRDEKASVWFGAAHADTRAAIETALPRLREMFESQGLSLADAGVFHEPPREQQPAVKSSSMSGEQGDTTGEVATVSSRVQLGLVDAYA
jgi:flagellar hook-length control protein FliK